MNSARITFTEIRPATMATNGMKSSAATYEIRKSGLMAGKLSKRGGSWVVIDYTTNGIAAFAPTLAIARKVAKTHFTGKLQDIFSV